MEPKVDHPPRRRWILAAICALYLGLVVQRVTRYATFEPASLSMPPPISDAVERDLYLTPGGKYSLADIAANGSLLPSEKFRGFQARHDFGPQPGDRLCPITRTKAHPECSWIIGGQTYEFCCPPCISEFVSRAKEHPERVQLPSAYIATP
jgi:hypothetical protein